LQTLGFAIDGCQAFLRLSDLVAQIRSACHYFHNGQARLLLLMLQIHQSIGCGHRLLLAPRQLLLRSGYIGGGGIQHLAVGIALHLQRGKPISSLL